MRLCLAFVNGVPNAVMSFNAAGRLTFRRIDAENWRMADLLQYIDDQLAAELRQVQRMLAIVAAGMLALEVYYGLLVATAKVDTTEIGATHVQRAAYVL
eukprot:899220-Pyramimonas_sp.AAC.1